MRLYPDDPFRRRECGRPDGYFRVYAGREYDGEPLEVATMHIEAVLGDSCGKLRRLAGADGEMLDLVLGMLLHFKP